MDESGKNNLIFIANGEKRLERFVNINIYSSSNVEGIGGLYKYDFKDFIVKEIIKGRYTLEIKEDNPSSSFSKESKDRFTTFNLIKINKETFEVIKILSKTLKIPIDSIYYSGLKDKCSISVQKMSIRGNFIEILRDLKLKDIFIRNIYPSKKSVKLGSNWGNQFIITVRNIEKFKNTLTKINKIFKILKNQGFPNYFGLQRFGTFRPNSHLIGRFILEGKFKEAFDEYVVNSYATESMRSQKIRNELRKSGDLEKAYNQFPNSLNYEKIMIKYLIENPDDYKGAV
ncbi:MAG: tRNA pseudouridine(13) synthase TruD, partial [Candidatus Hermodarchaeota archaeon]